MYYLEVYGLISCICRFSAIFNSIVVKEYTLQDFYSFKLIKMCFIVLNLLRCVLFFKLITMCFMAQKVVYLSELSM